MVRHSLIGFRDDQKGSSIIETAILIPVMILLCCGSMDFARVMYAGVSVASAARAGVQFGALSPGNSGNQGGMVQAAKNDAADLGLDNLTATASNFCACTGGTGQVPCSTGTCSGSTPNGYVSVTATYPFSSLVAWPGLPQTITLTSTAKMRVQ